MSLPRLTANLNNISSLPDKPTLQSDELKQTFDLAGNTIKEYINDDLLDAIEALITTTVNASKTIVENTLTSTSTTKALSSAQGKLLKEYIDTLTTSVNGKQKTITSGTSAPTGGSDGDIYIQYFD